MSNYSLLSSTVFGTIFKTRVNAEFISNGLKFIIFIFPFLTVSVFRKIIKISITCFLLRIPKLRPKFNFSLHVLCVCVCGFISSSIRPQFNKKKYFILLLSISMCFFKMKFFFCCCFMYKSKTQHHACKQTKRESAPCQPCRYVLDPS